ILFSVLGSRPVMHEFLIGIFVTITTPVTLMLLGRATIYRDRTEGNPEGPALSAAGAPDRAKEGQADATTGAAAPSVPAAPPGCASPGGSGRPCVSPACRADRLSLHRALAPGAGAGGLGLVLPRLPGAGAGGDDHRLRELAAQPAAAADPRDEPD